MALSLLALHWPQTLKASAASRRSTSVRIARRVGGAQGSVSPIGIRTSTGTATTGAGGGGGSAEPPLVEQAVNPPQHKMAKITHIFGLGMGFLLDGADSGVGGRLGTFSFEFRSTRHLFGSICVHAQTFDRRRLSRQGGIALRQGLVTSGNGRLPSVEFGRHTVVFFHRHMQ